MILTLYHYLFYINYVFIKKCLPGGKKANDFMVASGAVFYIALLFIFLFDRVVRSIAKHTHFHYSKELLITITISFYIFSVLYFLLIKDYKKILSQIRDDNKQKKIILISISILLYFIALVLFTFMLF